MNSKKAWGIALLSSGAGLTVLLAVLGNVEQPPSAQTQGTLAALALSAQLGASWVFSGLGRADPSMAERAISRLMTVGQRAADARIEVEKLHESKLTAVESRNAMGRLSVTLSYLEEGYVEAIKDWEVFHPDAVEKARFKISSETEVQNNG
ncbi:hypothetical protein ACH9D2_07125 [Kocuria sp. M4R2S49]|uniref:hypothetical protein n=1 Tax=Kocuria rhizosphaericola TaxID=3376284 RepID=UPI0037BAF8B5